MVNESSSLIRRLRTSRPLVLCLTNGVVRNFTANLLLAAHAVPAMLENDKEAEEMLQTCANALLVNVGTYSQTQADTMRAAVSTAHSLSLPWVLDPVAVGLLSPRTAFCHELITLYPPVIIRGNASEILALSGHPAVARGPESTDVCETALPAARELAKATGAAVLVTGPTDYTTDGSHTYAITGGHELMTRVTGVGCAMGALAAALCAVSDNALHAAVTCSQIFSHSGTHAAMCAHHPGSFATAFLDTVDDCVLSAHHAQLPAAIETSSNAPSSSDSEKMRHPDAYPGTV